MPSLSTSAVLVGVGLASVVLVSAAVADRDDSVEAHVVKIVDGDTLDVAYDGSEHRIRLLNVDAPESVNPNELDECLGQEASDYLKALLPVGAAVTLGFDEELLDRYDRELAGVTFDGKLVNAEIAREGLGVPVFFAPNDRYLDEVQAAWAEAAEAERGLFDETLGCTVPAQVAAVESAQQDLEGSVPAEDASRKQVEAYLADLDKRLAAAAALLLVLDGDRNAVPLAGFANAEIERLRATVSEAHDEWSERSQRLRDALEDEEEQQRAAEAKAEAERKAEEAAAQERADRAAAEKAAAEKEAADKAAAEKAERDRAQREAEERERRAVAPPPPPPSAPAPTHPPAPAPPAPPSNYNGCRSYAPGGGSWTPIDCKTKLPINP